VSRRANVGALRLRTDEEQDNLRSAKLQWTTCQSNLWLIGLLSATESV
jgi:hypothetical protein